MSRIQKLCSSAVIAPLALLSLAGTASSIAVARDKSAPAPQATQAGGGAPVAAGQQVANEEALEQVIVTGSRLITDGSAAPTPVTVVSPDFLANLQTPNIPQALQTLPQFSDSISNNRRLAVQGPNASGNVLNIRGLGTTRTLILLDGARVPATGNDGSVDSNVIPEMLVQRVDVVTGGASAAYGSDAVSGVVNFVLDRNFIGFKGVAQSGISYKGDANTYRAGGAYGGTFDGGRVRVLASAEYANSEPITSFNNRPLGSGRYLFTGTGTAANPWVISTSTIYANASMGGVVTSGPFAGQQFLPGGQLGPYNPGTPTGLAGINTGVQAGGEDFVVPWLSVRLREWKAFARASYQLTDSIEAWVQGTAAQAKYYDGAAANDFRLGNVITIFSGNAYLTPEQQAALGSTPSFTLSRLNRELGTGIYADDSRAWSVLAGLQGKLFGDWSWNLTAQRGDADSLYTGILSNNVHFFAAIDAVRDASGNIVCRVTLTNPGLYPGCAPINLFGQGSPSQAAVDYIRGESWGRTVNTTNDYSASIQGKPFSTWAGPVGLAIGAEYRSLTLRQTSNSNPAAPPPFTGIRGVPTGTLGYYVFNTGVSSGSQSVREAFAEVALPLAKDMPGLHALDADLAGRVTDYRTSGRVTTWKLGLSWAPMEDFRFRATRSSDIRAPDLFALFAGNSVTPPLTVDPHTGISRSLNIVSGGNPNLQPEKADTYVIGAVFTPTWLDAFTMTVDYYSIDINAAITSLNAAQILSICESSGGAAPECAFITRPLPFSDRTPANFPTSVFTGPINAAVFRQKGVDFEADYSHSLFSGTLQTRLLGTWLRSYKTQANVAAPLWELAGQSGAIDNSGGQRPYPKLRMTFQATYARDPYSVTLSQQYIGSMKQSFVAVVAPGFNDVRAVHYTALTLKFRLMQGALEPFASINNLFNAGAPLIPISRGSPNVFYPTAQLRYDTVGRYYTAGVRFRF